MFYHDGNGLFSWSHRSKDVFDSRPYHIWELCMSTELIVLYGMMRWNRYLDRCVVFYGFDVCHVGVGNGWVGLVMVGPFIKQVGSWLIR